MRASRVIRNLAGGWHIVVPAVPYLGPDLDTLNRPKPLANWQEERLPCWSS